MAGALLSKFVEAGFTGRVVNPILSSAAAARPRSDTHCGQHWQCPQAIDTKTLTPVRPTITKQAAPQSDAPVERMDSAG